MKSARRIYKSSKSDLMPYSVHTVKSRSSSKKKKKNAETKMMHGKKSVSQFVSGKGMHTAGHTRESLCELTCLCSDYMSVYLSVYNTYTYVYTVYIAD